MTVGAGPLFPSPFHIYQSRPPDADVSVVQTSNTCKCPQNVTSLSFVSIQPRVSSII
jgi:hypothetical protein